MSFPNFPTNLGGIIVDENDKVILRIEVSSVDEVSEINNVSAVRRGIETLLHNLCNDSDAKTKHIEDLESIQNAASIEPIAKS